MTITPNDKSILIDMTYKEYSDFMYWVKIARVLREATHSLVNAPKEPPFPTSDIK